MTKPLETEGAIAVVTGGAGGIGHRLCEKLLASGARHVVVADRDGPMADKVADGLRADFPADAVSAASLDVADDSAVADVVAEVERNHGAIDIWCSNAGVSTGEGIGSEQAWALSVGVNLMGHVNAARHVLPGMVARGHGHFIVTASAAGLLSDFRSAPYTASKHAAVGFAEWLAITHGGDGISVHCICPEGVRTGMTRSSSAKAGSGMEFLEPGEMVARSFEQFRAGIFLVLPHPRVAEFERRRADDRQRWIGGMRKALLASREAARSSSTNQGE